jgi:hypothetical protein
LERDIEGMGVAVAGRRFFRDHAAISPVAWRGVC